MLNCLAVVNVILQLTVTTMEQSVPKTSDIVRQHFQSLNNLRVIFTVQEIFTLAFLCTHK